LAERSQIREQNQDTVTKAERNVLGRPGDRPEHAQEGPCPGLVITRYGRTLE
jgi:hypothetical protein